MPVDYAVSERGVSDTSTFAAGRPAGVASFKMDEEVLLRMRLHEARLRGTTVAAQSFIFPGDQHCQRIAVDHWGDFEQ